MMDNRTYVIFQAAHRYATRNKCWPAYAATVREIYEERTPAEFRHIQFSDRRDAYERARLDAQTIRRFEDHAHGLPADLEESMVYALPPEIRQELRRELFRRYGSLDAPVPQNEHGEVGPEVVAHLSSEFADVVQRISEMLASQNRIGPEDAPLAAVTLNEIDDLLGVTVSLRHAVSRTRRAS